MSIPVTCECGRLFETAEASAGLHVSCPECGRMLPVPLSIPKPVVGEEDLFDAWERPVTATSGKAVASLVLGALFFLACLSGIPAILLGNQARRDIEASKGRLRGRWMAAAGTWLGAIGCLITVVALFLPATRSARGAARRSQCVNNLKQIGLAMFNYHEVSGCLPPAAITSTDGRPLLSWRVAILPYMEQASLYARFHLDEPWNSPHNMALLDEEPSFYICPSDSSWKRGMTEYQAVIGPHTAFRPDLRPLAFADFTDGTSNTLLVGEADRGVPWTKPDDLPFATTHPLHGLGSYHGSPSNGFNALFADGSVHFLKPSINPNILTALLTRDGGEVIDASSY